MVACSGVQAQTSASDPVDVQGWYGVGVGMDLKKKWSAGIDYQARFQNNLASYKGSYISFSGSKGISKRIDLLAEYRLGLVTGAMLHRFSVGGEYQPKSKAVDLGIRILVLNNIQDFEDPTSASKKTGFWRARLKVGKKLTKKCEGYLSTEPVMQFGGNSFVDNWRNTIGTKWKVGSNAKLDVFYMYRPDYAKASYNRLFHVVGLSLDFSTAPGKKKK
ncbi:MAG: DUF2490 domain-containing protein [Bacteroidota bacterium]